LETDKAERVDGYWSRFLGVPASALQNPGVVVTPHAELGDYPGVWFFVRGRAAVVSAPPEWVVELERNLRTVAAQELAFPDSAARVVGEASGRVVGPSFQGWLPARRFRPVTPDSVQRLAESDADPIQVFQTSCPREDWDQSGIRLAAAPIWASFEEPAIVALGQLRPHSEGAVDPCVVTHPDHRGQGHASRLVSAMVHSALSRERLVLYQTLLANVPAVALARRLGFSQYATVVAVRLPRDAVQQGDCC